MKSTFNFKYRIVDGDYHLTSDNFNNYDVFANFSDIMNFLAIVENQFRVYTYIEQVD